MKTTLCLFFSLTLLLVACSDETQQTTTDSLTCEEAIATLEACDPNLAVEASCTDETLEMVEELGGTEATCGELQDAGKADWFSFGGCAPGQHVCSVVFCCDDYLITHEPISSDFDIIDAIEAFQAEAPASVQAEIDNLSDAALLDVVSWTWEQYVAEPGQAAAPMAVELTMGLIPVAYDDFVAALPPADWGLELDHYLGGERWILAEDAEGRPTLQAERMVLSALPCDFEKPLLNQDMTKGEVIVYGPERAKVYWRVYASDNLSTEADVGSVTFEAHSGGTLVTFHSAHLLRAVAIPLPNAIAQASLGPFFEDHVRHYGELVH